MDLRNIGMAVFLAGCLVGALVAPGQESATPPQAPTPASRAPAADPLGGIELKPLPVGSTVTHFFEHTAASRQVGYSELTLVVLEQAGRPVYDYRHLTDVTFGGERTTTLVEATLAERFVPKEVRVNQTKISPEGAKTTTQYAAIVEDREIVLTRSADGKVESRRVLRPATPFVYGLALVVERIDFTKYDAFQLAELDPQAGTAFTYTFSSTIRDDGTRLVRAAWGVEGSAFFFFLDDEGALDGWGQIPPKLEARRTTSTQVQELKKRLKLD